MSKKLVFLAFLVCLGAGSCSPNGASSSAASPTPSAAQSSPTLEAASTPAMTPTPEVFQPLPADQHAFEAVRSVLANNLGVDPLTITLVDVKPVRWPDSCLGLPHANEMCSQVVTSGFLVHVEAGGTTYEFHTNQGAEAIRQK